MALPTNLVWYTGSTKWTAVTAWAALTVYAAGVLRRQLAAPAVGSERVFVCIVAGTSLAAEPTWVITKGAKTAEAAGPTWQECTGQSSVNGDLTNTPTWTTISNNAIALGYIIQRNNGASYQICSTAGTAGNGAEPAFSDTAGTTTADNTVTWTSLGAVGNFGPWTAPFARLASAFTTNWGADGNIFYVSNNHAETQSTAITIAPRGAPATPSYILCVVDTVAPPTSAATTASITTTGASNLSVTGTGSNPTYYVYGIIFNSGTGAVTGSVRVIPSLVCQITFENCAFNVVATGSSSVLLVNNGSSGWGNVIYYNCTFSFGATGQAISFNAGNVFIIGGSTAATGSAPTTLIGNNASGGTFLLKEHDLSNITGTIANAGSTNAALIRLENCKLGSGVTPFTGSIVGLQMAAMYIHNSDSTSTNYRYYYANYAGVIQQETTIIRTGGATNGVTPISWSTVSTATCSFYQPLQFEQIMEWNDFTGSQLTVTIEINSGGTLTNGDVWMLLEYLGSSSTPLGTALSTRKATILTASANLTSSTASWAGGLSGSTPQKITANFTPQMKGPVKVTMFVGKASQTVYIDPMFTLSDANGNIKSSGRQFFVPGWGQSLESAPSLIQLGLSGGARG